MTSSALYPAVRKSLGTRFGQFGWSFSLKAPIKLNVTVSACTGDMKRLTAKTMIRNV